MHIVYGKEQADRLKDKYTVLELDTVKVEEVNQNLTLYAVVNSESLGLIDLPQLEQWCKLHQDLIRNLKKKDKNFCLQAVEHLLGKFGGEIDSFYEHVRGRFEDTSMSVKEKVND